VQALARQLYAHLNAAGFQGRLPCDLGIRWNLRLRMTAGRCLMERRREGGSLTAVNSAAIELSAKVLTSRERLSNTLAHEMCHAAAWLLDGECQPPHGAAFKKWANHAMKARLKGWRVLQMGGV